MLGEKTISGVWQGLAKLAGFDFESIDFEPWFRYWLKNFDFNIDINDSIYINIIHAHFGQKRTHIQATYSDSNMKWYEKDEETIQNMSLARPNGAPPPYGDNW